MHTCDQLLYLDQKLEKITSLARITRRSCRRGSRATRNVTHTVLYTSVIAQRDKLATTCTLIYDNRPTRCPVQHTMYNKTKRKCRKSSQKFTKTTAGLLISKYRVPSILYRRYFLNIDGVIANTYEKSYR